MNSLHVSITVMLDAAFDQCRSDMLLISESSKQIVLLELTVPSEDRIDETNKRKRAKSGDLVEEWLEQWLERKA